MFSECAAIAAACVLGCRWRWTTGGRGIGPSATTLGLRQCDFNFISKRNDPDAPTGFLQFTLEIGNNNGVLLTNFAPESVPEPSSLVLAGTVALVGLGVG